MILMNVFQAASALSLALLTAGSAYGISAWLIPEGSTARRWSASVVVAFWFQIIAFQVLAWWNAFRLPWAIGVTILFALVTGFFRSRFPQGERTLGSFICGDIENIRVRLNQALATSARPLVLAGIAVAAVGVIRGIINMPITTDSLTYHLTYAGMFVRTGGWIDIDTPGIWGVTYRFYPTGGEILTAWFILPFHGDLIAGLASIPAWGLVLASSYELGRKFGIPVCRAALAACMIGFMPAVFAFNASVYVDLALLGCLLAGTLFFIDTWQTEGTAAGFLCGAALGCGLAIKIFGLAGVIAALLMLMMRWGASPRRYGRVSSILVMIAALAAVGLRHYWLLFVKYGSPTWPMPLGLPGIPLFAGSTAWAAKLRYLADAVDTRISGGSLLHELIWYMTWSFGVKPVSIGPVGIIGMVLAPKGLKILWDRFSRGVAAYCALSLAASAGALFGSGMWKFHVIFASVNARLNTFPVALLIMLGFLALEQWRDGPRKVIICLLIALNAVAVTFSLTTTWTTGFPWFDRLLLLLPVIATLLPIRNISQSVYHCRGTAIALGLTIFASLSVLPVFKAGLRPIQLMTAYEGHELGREISPAWVLCDDVSRPRRIAFSTGWGIITYEWLWAPLMGRSLQNHVTYLPITNTGEIIEYDDPALIAKKADFDAWYRRLQEQRIDTVVLFPPFPPEHDWVMARPDLFVPEGPASPTMVFRVMAKEKERQ
ncbi:hypothetical protein KBA41_07745 [Candidatus Ozemobacteraceae bacterium]|nr:hypothetical protein [Candidatus Ozemobacteraceae bacterium]